MRSKGNERWGSWTIFLSTSRGTESVNGFPGPLPPESKTSYGTLLISSIHFQGSSPIRPAFAKCSHTLLALCLSVFSTIASSIRLLPSVSPTPIARILQDRLSRSASLTAARMPALPVDIGRSGSNRSSKRRRC